MRKLALVFFLLLSGPAHAVCSNSYGLLRNARIVRDLTSDTFVSPIVIVGPSHIERAAIAYMPGEYEINGHPVLFAGIAGAEWDTLRDCIPWSTINSLSPFSIVLQGGVNDAANGTCCDTNGDVTTARAYIMMQTIETARAITSNIVIASDPPPEDDAGIDTYKNHQMARVAYYLAQLNVWVALGWATQPAHLPFIDNYYNMRGASCTPAISAYSTPCYAGSNATEDNVHWNKENTTLMLDNIASAF